MLGQNTRNEGRHVKGLLEAGGEIAGALDEAGIVGRQLRETLHDELMAKIVLRGGRDAVEIVGAPGSGKKMIVRAALEVGRRALGLNASVYALRCAETRLWEGASTEEVAERALKQAHGGALVLEGLGSLSLERRRALIRWMRRQEDQTLILATTAEGRYLPADDSRAPTSIFVKPLHERQEDLWELIAHFYGDLEGELGLGECTGFSRQAMADISEAVQETSIASVRRLRDLVHDMVYRAAARGPLPYKLTSEHVRPVLEEVFQQTERGRRLHEMALVQSRFEAVGAGALGQEGGPPRRTDEAERALIARLSELHQIPAEVLAAEVALLREVVASVEGVPRSYRNIMTKAQDIQRVALWVLTGAETQADFRKFFGKEAFMRPTKSVAWAFYNRVFKRDC